MDKLRVQHLVTLDVEKKNQNDRKRDIEARFLRKRKQMRNKLKNGNLREWRSKHSDKPGSI